jgi:P-type Ca2+ transporter type 2C
MEEKGLTSKESEELLKKYGLNELKDLNKKGPLKILFHQVKSNFVIYLLLFAMILSFAVRKNLTANVILIVIIIVIATGFIQEYKADRAIKALKSMLLPVSIVIRDGKEIELSSKELVPGDIILLRSGEKIPADCIVLEQKNLLINESIITGESKEVTKKIAKNEREYFDENLLFMGSFVIEGKCFARIIHTGMNTKFGKIAGLISSAEKDLPLQRKLNKIAKVLAIFGVSFSILTGIIMILRTPGFNKDILVEALIIVIAIAVSSFPEGFPVVLITALSTGAHRMAKKNAIVNRMSIIETLGETTVICSDKTGTITRGEMTVKRVLVDGRVYYIDGAGYEAHGDFKIDNRIISPKEDEVLIKLLKAGVLCNDAKIERTGEDMQFKIHGAPTEAALLVLASKANIYADDLNCQRIEEIPFNSNRKMMSVLCGTKKESNLYSKGAPEIIIENCKYIQRANGVFRLNEKEKKKIIDINKKLTSETFRTLAIACKQYSSEIIQETDLIFLGLVAIEDPPKPEVYEAIKICLNSGIKIKMITGDNKETAQAIGKQVGLEGKLMEGFELDKITEEELSKIVSDIVIFARVKPEHKLKIVRALKNNDEIVTMTGDGVNDAPALKEAHIGVAMGKAGTDVSREVADLTLKDDNFATIVEAIKEGRTIFTNIQKFATYQTSVNFSQVMLIFLAILIGLPTPLVAIQILFMNLFSDEITAITLAFNPYSKDVISNKPRKKSEIITKPLFLMLVLAGLIMSLGSLGIFYYVLSIGKSEMTAQTIAFTTMVFFGIANAYNFRSFRKTSINRSPYTNKPLFWASVFAIILTIFTVYNPFMNRIFETIGIKPLYLVWGALISFTVIVAFDILKHINEKKNFWTEDMQHFN